MRNFLQKAKSKRRDRREEKKTDAKLLQAAVLMAHEYPQGTSPYFIASQLKRNR